jgi:hypothetical protein
MPRRNEEKTSKQRAQAYELLQQQPTVQIKVRRPARTHSRRRERGSRSQLKLRC